MTCEISKAYNVLRLPNPSSKLEIRRAYKKLAIQFHPDKNPNPDSNKHFQDVSNAYQTLMKQSDSSFHSKLSPLELFAMIW